MAVDVVATGRGTDAAGKDTGGGGTAGGGTTDEAAELLPTGVD